MFHISRSRPPVGGWTRLRPVLRTLALATPAALGTIAAACAGPAALATADAAPAQAAPQGACEVAAYRSSGGDAVVLLRAGERFHYIFLDGRRNWVVSENSPIRCGPGVVYVERSDGATETWPRTQFRETPTRFVSDGTTFFGRLIEPTDASGDRPLVVFAHGSGDAPMASGERPWPPELDFLVAQGVSVFVFDKRGTGESEGTFTMNFHRLAKDLVAASAEARRLAAGRFGRFGLFGMSQGGWVAPLAAEEAGAEFLLIAVGAVYSPTEEDSEEVFAELRRKGYGEDVIAKARQVTDATGVVRASLFERGYERLAQVREEYGHEPWFSEIEGEFTGSILKASEAELRARAGENKLEIPWSHDAVAVLRSLSIPQLWILAAEDEEAPIHLNIQRLTMLQNEGKPIQMAIFPNTGHAMIEFYVREDGTRRHTRFPEHLRRLMADWVKGCLRPPYGAAEFYPPLREGEGCQTPRHVGTRARTGSRGRGVRHQECAEPRAGRRSENCRGAERLTFHSPSPSGPF
ncbi:MAG: alpha/beta hydrolase [Gemmatimonadetes bacterium]|nr:alpha/beta hydrolase [Gemmatimonadota bacterium]